MVLLLLRWTGDTNKTRIMDFGVVHGLYIFLGSTVEFPCRFTHDEQAS